MEHIFLESLVLQSLIDTPLTTDYIFANYRDIMPDYQILDTLNQEFINMYQDNISQILETNIGILISILHKYRITRRSEG